MARKVEKLDWSMSLFVLYFGTDKLYRDQVAHHSVLFGPRYKELLDEIFRGHALPEDFSLYLHAPTVTDPSLAPEGCDAFYVLSPVPHLGNAPIDWQKTAPVYAEKILASLEKLMPDLRKHVVSKRWITPETFRDELQSHHGSAFSCAPKLTQSAWWRARRRARSSRTTARASRSRRSCCRRACATTRSCCTRIAAASTTRSTMHRRPNRLLRSLRCASSSTRYTRATCSATHCWPRCKP
jgi:phytoene desaturase